MKTKEMTLNIFIGLSVILLIAFVLWFMFGNSPTLEQMLVVLVLPIYLFVFGVYERLNNRISGLHNRLSDTREGIQKQLGDIKISLAKIEGKVKL